MNNSAELGELFAALSSAQGKFSNAYKGSQGHGYNYADLAQCIDTVKPVLAENGLAVTQMLGDKDGKQTLITVLGHKSGQYISSEFCLVSAMLQGGAGKNPAQLLGSAITYQRRYAFAAIVGLAQTDDDAANIQAQPQPQQQPKAQLAAITDNQVQWIKGELANGATHNDIIARMSAKLDLAPEAINQIKSLGV